jgi:MYXO-CTERM domain-containing protein
VLLDGLTILSFCHFLQGPAAMQYLADMGADVIKIEPPSGAFERHWAGADCARVGGVSALFLCANRNVRSLSLDLKHPEAKDVVFRLLDRRHVLAENYRPGALDRLGLGYEAVRTRKPDIIYASASGFGATGPMSGRPGQDLLIQAMSGLMVANGRGERPAPVGCAAADQHGAALFALGILGAYARWQRTGEGTRVEASLFGAAVDLQMESLVTYSASRMGREVFTRDEHLADWFHEAPYGVYKVRDAYLALSMNDIGRLADALACDPLRALADRNAYHDRDEIVRCIADAVQARDFADLATALDTKAIWYAKVDDYDDLFANPQAQHNETFRDVVVNDETVRLLNHPLRYDGSVPGHRSFPLTQGADTRPVLEEIGFTSAEVNELLRNGVAFAGE